MFVSGVVKSKLDNKGKVIDKDLSGKLMCPMHPEVVKDSPGSCDVCGMPLVKAEELGYSTQTASDVNAPLVIPSTAPMITGKRAVVYVEIPNDDGTVFEGREVELGPRAGDFYVVKSGLEEGERVVINGTFKIDSELQIQAKPSMMSPEGGGGPVGHQHGTQTASSTDRIRHKTEGKKIGKYSISTDALEALTPLYESYFEIQMALANDDLDASVKGYKKLPLRAKEVDMSLFEGDAHMAWMEFANDISTASNKGNTSSLEETRQSFLSVSKAIVRLESTFGHGDGKTYYLIFCSMANDNKGVHWLQDVDTVYNPFYGESMLRCGEIKKTLAPVNPVNRGTHVK
jgi:Cu(I)/Ag(I) efflux system membrane fusion protein